MFQDPNFKLALLEYCTRLKKTFGFGWNADYEEFCMRNFGELVTDNDYEPSQKIKDFFTQLIIPNEDLQEIRSLTLDGDNSVYSYIINDFANSPDLYQISSLDGIEHLVNLQTLNLASMVRRISLIPLANLPTLEELSFDFTQIEDVRELTKIPNLKRIHVWNYPAYKGDKDEISKLVVRLKKKNIAVNL